MATDEGTTKLQQQTCKCTSGAISKHVLVIRIMSEPIWRTSEPTHEPPKCIENLW
jgi:hypothetical protein